jgi:hypothetical protein
VTREERNQLLEDLRAAGVASARVDPMGYLAEVVFFPAAPAAVAEERTPRPKRTADQRLFGPLGINDGQKVSG